MNEVQDFDNYIINNNEGVFITHMNDLLEKSLDDYGDEEWDELDDEDGY